MMRHVGHSVHVLDEYEAKRIDAILRYSPPWAVTFVSLWYRSDMGVKEIAQALSIRNRQSVYQERTLVLGYFLGRFVAEGMKVHNQE